MTNQVETFLAGGAVRVESSKADPNTLKARQAPDRVISSRNGYCAASDASTGSVLATLQRVNGADTVELKPGQAHTRTHIGAAVREGLLVPTGPGTYRDR